LTALFPPRKKSGHGRKEERKASAFLLSIVRLRFVSVEEELDKVWDAKMICFFLTESFLEDGYRRVAMKGGTVDHLLSHFVFSYSRMAKREKIGKHRRFLRVLRLFLCL
jgi:hypothetical protein